MTKQEQDMLHEYKETVCVFLLGFQRIFIFQPIFAMHSWREREGFLSVVYGGELVKLESKHTRLVVKMTGSDGI